MIHNAVAMRDGSSGGFCNGGVCGSLRNREESRKNLEGEGRCVILTTYKLLVLSLDISVLEEVIISCSCSSGRIQVEYHSVPRLENVLSVAIS